MRILKSTILFYLILFSFIEFIVRADWISSSLLPRPTQILELFISHTEIWIEPFLRTAGLALMAYILASAFAFLLALTLRQFQQLQKNVMPLTLFFQTVPIIAIAPLLVIYFGFGIPAILSAALIVCFFPVLASTLVGLSQAQKNHVELFSFLKASRTQILLHLEIPSAVPHILAGLKTSAGLSVVGVVSGEFVAGGGLGALIDSARLQQRVDIVFAALICLSVLALFLMKTTESFFRLIFKSYLPKID
jgi:NitT/TauT family transport system permease protein